MAMSKVAPGEGGEEARLEDEDVVEALQSGDRRRALTLLMSRHGERIFRYAMGMTGDSHLAEEIRQQVFVDAYRDLPRFAGRSQVRTWLFGIARHRVLDATKARRRWTKRYKQEPPDEPDVYDRDPDDELDRHRLAGIIEGCLRKLAPAALEAIMLRFQQELSYGEVAALIGDRAGTVQQRVARALPVLRKCVDAQLNPGAAR